MFPYVRTVETASGATAVQIVYSSRRGSRRNRASRVGARRRRAGGVEGRGAAAACRGAGQFDLGLPAEAAGGPRRGPRRWRSLPRGLVTCGSPSGGRSTISGWPTRPTRPIYRHKRESIEAHLTIVFAASPPAGGSRAAPAGPSSTFARAARRYRTLQIRIGSHVLTAERPATRRPTRHARAHSWIRCALT